MHSDLELSNNGMFRFSTAVVQSASSVVKAAKASLAPLD
jgi:hypothetical protein